MAKLGCYGLRGRGDIGHPAVDLLPCRPTIPGALAAINRTAARDERPARSRGRLGQGQGLGASTYGGAPNEVRKTRWLDICKVNASSESTPF